jgi:hypothetical protein
MDSGEGLTEAVGTAPTTIVNGTLTLAAAFVAVSVKVVVILSAAVVAVADPGQGLPQEYRPPLTVIDPAEESCPVTLQLHKLVWPLVIGETQEKLTMTGAGLLLL